MKQRILLAAFGATGVILLAGCAKTTQVEGAPAPVSSNVTASAGARWLGNIQSVTQSTGAVQQTSRDRSYGSATWSLGDGPTLSKVDIVFNYNGSERSLTWAIIPGSCGTVALPTIPMSNFPELQVGGGGRAQVTASLPLSLPSNGTYHIDVYRDRRAGPESLVACGNLRYNAG